MIRDRVTEISEIVNSLWPAIKWPSGNGSWNIYAKDPVSRKYRLWFHLDRLPGKIPRCTKNGEGIILDFKTVQGYIVCAEEIK